MFNFGQLDEDTRQYMKEEVELDHSTGRLYVSRRFSDAGIAAYLGLLTIAIETGNDDSLKASLEPIPGTFWLAQSIDKNGRTRFCLTDGMYGARSVARSEK